MNYLRSADFSNFGTKDYWHYSNFIIDYLLKQMYMSIDYDSSAKSLPLERIEDIIKYYKAWNGNFEINFKFRFLKAFTLNIETNTTQWIYLHRVINRRRIQNKDVPLIIRNLIDENVIPIRIFYSVSEWLAPNEIDKRKFPWLLKSNILPIETDETLAISLDFVKYISSKIKGNRKYVFSGNKSIHIWLMDFSFENYLEESEKRMILSAQSREKYDRLARRRFTESLQKFSNIEIDIRNAIDTKRVLPIIDSINGFTGNKVIELDATQLENLTTEKILMQAKPHFFT